MKEEEEADSLLDALEKGRTLKKLLASNRQTASLVMLVGGWDGLSGMIHSSQKKSFNLLPDWI